MTNSGTVELLELPKPLAAYFFQCSVDVEVLRHGASVYAQQPDRAPTAAPFRQERYQHSGVIGPPRPLGQLHPSVLIGPFYGKNHLAALRCDYNPMPAACNCVHWCQPMDSRTLAVL